MTTKILLIEDDDGIRTTIGLFFKVVMPEAVYIDTAFGVHGVELVRTGSPDIILLDLGLPDISGFEVIRRVREFSSTPVIILTARREPGTEQRCRTLGADAFIPKPFHHRDMVDCINGFLRQETPVVRSI